MLIRIDLDGDMKKKTGGGKEERKKKLSGGVIAVTALSVGLIQGVVNINAGCPSGMARRRQSRDCSWGLGGCERRWVVGGEEGADGGWWRSLANTGRVRVPAAANRRR